MDRLEAMTIGRGLMPSKMRVFLDFATGRLREGLKSLCTFEGLSSKGGTRKQQS
jgi:hypothetical protein